MQPAHEIEVWGPLVRRLHRSLVATFALACLAGNEASRLHVWAGYGALGLAALRVPGGSDRNPA